MPLVGRVLCKCTSLLISFPLLSSSATLLSLLAFHIRFQYCFSPCYYIFGWLKNYLVLNENKRTMEDIGDEYLSELLSSSVFEPKDESYVKMRDLMQDITQVVLGDSLARHELESPSKFYERARHISYVVDHFDGISKFQAIHNTKCS